MMKISLCSWYRSAGVTSPARTMRSHISVHRRTASEVDTFLISVPSLRERERERITEPGSVAQCNTVVKYIMFCTLRALHRAQQSGIKSWSRANTNKGVSALSPAIEFSFLCRDCKMKRFRREAEQPRYSNVQRGWTVGDVIYGLRFQHACGVLGNVIKVEREAGQLTAQFFILSSLLIHVWVHAAKPRDVIHDSLDYLSGLFSVRKKSIPQVMSSWCQRYTTKMI